MKNIFIEGLQGAGKSTLLQTLTQKLPAYHTYREGDLCPVELAWCSYMTKEQYQAALDKFPKLDAEIRKWTCREEDHYIVAYTRILTDYEGFHKYMEEFEIYNGRRGLEELERIIFHRFHIFEGSGNLFECAFFQNIVEDMILFHQASDEEIIDFYQKLFTQVNKKSFVLLYLDSENVESNIRTIMEERVDEQGNPMWYQMMLNYLKESPYGKTHGCESFAHLIKHLEHRQQLEKRIVNEVLKDNAIVLPSKNWEGRLHFEDFA